MLACIPGGLVTIICYMQVSFPGVVCETFRSLLEFLYTGMTSVDCVADSFSMSRCMDLIEVADRLCQPSLVAHVESVVVDVLSLAADSHKDLTDIVLSLLEPAQVTDYILSQGFYCLMHYSAKRGLACRLSVCLSVCL